MLPNFLRTALSFIVLGSLASQKAASSAHLSSPHAKASFTTCCHPDELAALHATSSRINKEAVNNGAAWAAASQRQPTNMAFLIGAQKSGTTLLFNELVARHPHIYSQRWGAPLRAGRQPLRNSKEPHFFDRVELTSFEEYVEGFEIERDTSGTYLDGTPEYLIVPSSACRIAAAFPGAKLIAVLRDPAQRALSGWNMERHRGGSAVEDFSALVDSEVEVLQGLGCSYEPSSRDVGKDESGTVDSKQEGEEGEALADEKRVKKGSRHERGEGGVRALANNYSDGDGPAAVTPGGLRMQRRMRRRRSRSVAGAQARQRPPPRQLLTTGGASWQRSPSLPSWDSCFGGSYSYCKDFEGNRESGVCPTELGPNLVRRGLYAYQLDWWLHHFPAEQLLVLNYDQLSLDLEGTLDLVIEFLGQDAGLKKGSPGSVSTKGFRTPYNASSEPASHRKALDKLYSFYSHSNLELYRLIESLGPASGWSGNFPATNEEHQERRFLRQNL